MNTIFRPLLYILISASIVLAQTGTLKGQIVNKSNGQGVPGAYLQLRGTILGAVSDADGNFVLRRVPPGKYSLLISVIGFQRMEVPNVEMKEGDNRIPTIELVPVALQGETVVITASKYEQDIQNVPASISTFGHEEIERRNSVTLDDALRYVPGVNMVDWQVNIRGSSGYSRGVGSRVMLVLDGTPFLAGDTGEINYESIPTSQIERVEVMKGAGSALYGSNALGGVIQVITKPIGEKPETHIRIYGGLYDNPYYSQWQWTNNYLMNKGLFVSHSRRIGKFSFILSGNKINDDSYRQNDYKNRWSTYGKLTYDISPYKSLTVSFNYMDQHRGNFIYWTDLAHALVPSGTQAIESTHSKRYYFSSSFRQVISPTFFYTVRGIWFHNNWRDTIHPVGNQSESDAIDGEIQFNQQLKKHFITWGVDRSISRVNANIFGEHHGHGAGIYAQDEMLVAEKTRITLGVRYDYQRIADLKTNSQLSPKLGAVYRPREGTALRLSGGSGFRAPSIAEAYTSTKVSGVEVTPNPKLKAEHSFSFEMGINQIVNEHAVIDIAAFQSDYSNLIEGGFVKQGKDFVIQFNNVTRARIQGAELQLSTSWFERKLFTNLGYTYLNPLDLTANQFLKYRSRHLFYFSGNLAFGFLQTGIDFRYLSRMDRIDEQFSTVITNGEKRVEVFVTDLRFRFDLKGMDLDGFLSFQVNNLFQYNYVELVGNIAPVRNFVLTYDYSF